MLFCFPLSPPPLSDHEVNALIFLLFCHFMSYRDLPGRIFFLCPAGTPFFLDAKWYVPPTPLYGGNDLLPPQFLLPVSSPLYWPATLQHPPPKRQALLFPLSKLFPRGLFTSYGVFTFVTPRNATFPLSLVLCSPVCRPLSTTHLT